MKKALSILVMLAILSLASMAQWSTDPNENNTMSTATGEQAIPKVATSESGITYIAWFSNVSGNYNVMLQKLDLYGTMLWDEAGLLVSDHPSMTWLTDWDMTVDQEDCAILTFQDIRNGDNDAFAYRISPEGEFLWGADGVELSTGPAFDAAPKVCVTNSGNAIIAWQADEVVILQKISADGEKLWGDNGITLSGSNSFSWPQLLPVGTDDVILKYFEDSGPIWAPTRHVYAQRYDADGNPVWSEAAVVSDAGGISAWTQVFPFINDGSDGFFMAWHDDRDSDMHSSVFVQHVSAEGTILLGEDGTEASLQANRQNFYPYLALPPGSEDIFVYWNEMDSDQNNRGIYGQKISPDGERLWTDNGSAFIEISSTNVYPFASSHSDQDMVVFYEEYFDGLNADISAMRISKEGDLVWVNETVELCAVQSEKVHSVAGHFAFGQWISAWEDSRNGNKDIYAQNLRLDGSLGPMTAGVVEVHPDTLYFEENPQTKQVHVINNTLEDYTLTYIDQYGDNFWMVDPYPTLPYTIPSGDSLVFDVYFEFITSEQINGYVYENLNIESTQDTHTVVIAINEALLTGLKKQKPLALNVFPSPSASHFTFDFTMETGRDDQLLILALSGQLIGRWDVYRKDKITWNGKDDTGNPLPAGFYIYQLRSAKGNQTGKIILTR
jgi:hypothetical protein